MSASGNAVDGLSYVGTGGEITGQLISANAKDTIATAIDTSASDVASVQYDRARSSCTSPNDATQAADGDRVADLRDVPSIWIVKTETYKEISD